MITPHPQGDTDEVHGTVVPGFERVLNEFARTPLEGGEAQLAVFVDSKLVVDLWTGDADDGEVLGPVFSCTKGAVHLVVALLVQDGTLDPDELVVSYWPEFTAGKQETTLRQLLTHQAGLVGVPGGFTAAEVADDDAIAERLSGQQPWWEPGTAFGYHALTLGALVGAVVRRVTGSSVAEVLRERIPTPAGADFFLGLPENLDSRFRPVLPMLPTTDLPPSLPPGTSEHLRSIAFNQVGAEPTDLLEHGNSLAVRRRGPASAGGLANARGMAALYAAAVTGIEGRDPLLDGETITAFSRLQTRGSDLVTGRIDRFALGFEATSRKYADLGRRAIGHSGAGGADAFADPDLGIAYAYTRTRMSRSAGGEAPENHRLVKALVESINQ